MYLGEREEGNGNEVNLKLCKEKEKEKEKGEKGRSLPKRINKRNEEWHENICEILLYASCIESP